MIITTLLHFTRQCDFLIFFNNYVFYYNLYLNSSCCRMTPVCFALTLVAKFQLYIMYKRNNTVDIIDLACHSYQYVQYYYVISHVPWWKIYVSNVDLWHRCLYVCFGHFSYFVLLVLARVLPKAIQCSVNTPNEQNQAQ